MNNQMADLLRKLYCQRTAERQWKAEAFLEGEISFQAWKEGLLATLRQALALPAQPGDLQIRYEGDEPLDGLIRRRITYLAEEGLRTPAYVLEPQDADAKTPVVICLHGHGYGVRDIVGLREEESYQKKFALSACRQKMIVIAPELAGFGELRLPEELKGGNDEQSSCHRLYTNLLACGRSLLGMRVNQVIQALNAAEKLYAGHPIGLMGISGGGTVGVLSMALDERIRAGVISGYANTYGDSILAMRHCVDNFWPDMVGQMEMPDLLCTIAPRPMLWETGSRDPIYPQSATMNAAQLVQKCYEQLNAQAAFEVDPFEGVHEIHGVRAFAFLKEHCV